MWTLRKPGSASLVLISTSLARVSLSRTGDVSSICRHDSGPGFSRSASVPMVPPTLVTISSRIASSGGLVTWANSCWK